jgi:ABC-type branched-subunit amino acid transport system substrate-binding protein
MRRTLLLAVTAALVATLVGVDVATARSHRPARRPASSHLHVVVHRGQAVQIAFTADSTDFPEYSQSFEHAIRMAIEQRPTVKGFRIRVNSVETRCAQDPNVDADDRAAASALVANLQNVAVIGHLCSAGFAAALEIYQAAGIVTITGSASADGLSSTVLNRTIVTDGDGGGAWLAAVGALPREQAWRSAFAAEFGAPPADLSDLYFDAASLLIARLRQVSRVDRWGDLVIDRGELADAVRRTVGFAGVSCDVSLDPVTGSRLNDPEALARCAAGG